jgi:type I restriction-modification system DNA methylase subunit
LCRIVYNDYMTTALNQVLDSLGISLDNPYLVKPSDDSSGAEWRSEVPYRLQKGIQDISPDAMYVQEGRPVILFFDLSANSRNKQLLSKMIWNLGGVPIVYFIEDTTVTILNGYLFDTNTSLFGELKTKKKQLGYWDVISGRLWTELNVHKHASRVDEQLLRNIQDAQEALVDDGLNVDIANSLIGRLLFCRYLIDRGVQTGGEYFQDRDTFLQLIKDKKNLYKMFAHLRDKFKGDLFPVHDNEEAQVLERHLNLLFRLFNGDEISTGQISLFNDYDFNIIPVELISEVYERFIGQKNQRDEGAYYTPAFLVDYILARTVKEKLREQEYCRVLDPSCGSGIFLVESLRNNIEKKREKNGEVSQRDLVEALTDNVYGIDKDPNAVNLTIFSLYLTLLDYQEPKDITKFRLPAIMNKNIFVADFFDLEHEFNTKLSNVELDFVVGNPPWKSESNERLHIKYFQENNIPVSDNQIAQSFLVRSRDFMNEATKCALIVTSKILYNHNALRFRQYFLENFSMNEILELSAVRSELFTNASAPSSVFFFSAKNDKDNTVKHTSLKPNIFLKYLSIIVIEKNDVKLIQQDYFLRYDWLWKVLVYGNVFDFSFIKRLMETHPSLYEVIQEQGLSVGQGLQRGGGDKNDASHLIGRPFLDTSTRYKALTHFHVNNHATYPWSIESVHRPRNSDLFVGPYVLIKKGFSPSSFKSVAAYSENDYVFSDSITAIKGSEPQKHILLSIAGILNSSFFSYYMLLHGSSAGIERAQGHNEKDRFTLPFTYSRELAESVLKVQNYANNYYDNDFYDAESHDLFLKSEEKLNGLILDAYQLSELEKSLIDYANDISIPLLNGKSSPYEPTSEDTIIEYVKVFKTYFDNVWNRDSDKHFKAEVYVNKSIVGINFKITSSDDREDFSVYKDDETMANLAAALDSSSEQITERVYLQRDVRGFQPDSFYVVKPNEAKNWHPAVGQIDLHEFVGLMVNPVLSKVKE